ncbi:sensor histidine kinase [Streptomonospora litoralis]|uniref:Sensor histidine kinase DesK n=1 Tax=Streptomonospora litoralis TaxID=2498135 RepID=A0A4P6Q3T3_9ACTN|nr:sensor histidine kinase [Streptomonospora litoralis]QBI54880.1 Sensor histidine kinase DesK [Streptomonospora litoralis]
MSTSEAENTSAAHGWREEIGPRLLAPPSASHGRRALWTSVGLTLLFSALMLPYGINALDGLEPPRRQWAIGVGTAYIGSYLVFVALGESKAWGVRLFMCALLLILGGALVFLMGVKNAWVLVFALCVISAFARTALAVGAVVLSVGAVGGTALLSGTLGAVMPELVLLASVGTAMILFIRLVEANEQLRRARDRIAAFAVVEERERVARDLHDILGHSLTTITVKAGLVRRLLESTGQPAVAEEAGEVERYARQALADVRATVSGYRSVTLAGALAEAGSALRAAGITARLPQAVDEVDPRVQQVFGYVVREAVTNAVRHSGASAVEVHFGRDWLVVEDDGPGTGPVETGNGLRGLRERVTARGGDLQAHRSAGGGFVVRAEVPVEGGRNGAGAGAHEGGTD